MTWDPTDGTIRYIDDYGNTVNVWRPGDPEYTQYHQDYFPGLRPEEESDA